MKTRRLAEALDRELADLIVGEGDELAFRELYGRHTPRLYQFVLRMMQAAEPEAEDVVQETWVRAVERLSRFRWESKLSTWLIGIAVNLCRDRLRIAARRGTVALDAIRPPAVPARNTTEERIDLERAIAALPAGYREVLLMHDVEGLTHVEIGERLGIAEGTSKSQLFFARRTMRRLLQPAGGENDGRSTGERADA